MTDEAAVTDPVAFLAARLDEDEAAAKADGGTGEWFARTVSGIHGPGVSAGPGVFVTDLPTSRIATTNTSAQARHMARHDPARVLREVDAGRRTLERHRPDRYGCQYCERFPGPGPCPDLADLLDRWSDHPDYDREWKHLTWEHEQWHARTDHPIPSAASAPGTAAPGSPSGRP